MTKKGVTSLIQQTLVVKIFYNLVCNRLLLLHYEA